MAQLKSIIGSILRDIIYAQHEANLYAVSLGESYGKDGKVNGFDLPNIMFSDIEMELRYAVVESEDKEEQSNISYSKFRKHLGILCAEVAKAVINEGVSTVLYSSIEREEDDKKFFLRLKQDKDLYGRFHNFLRKNFINNFDYDLYELVDSASGNVKEDKVSARFMAVVKSKFLNDTDISSLFAGANGKQLYNECERNIQIVVDETVKKMSGNLSFRRAKNYSQLGVEVSAAELEKLPSSAIQTFRFKFRPAETPPTLLDGGEEENDFDMN